jgi:hypothetical protein
MQTLRHDLRPAPGPDAPAIAAVVPFRPRGRMAPLVLLHIPKTSGSSCNRLLADLYGADNFIDHAEYRLPGILSGRTPPMRVDGISAHVPLCRWALYRGSDAYARVTVLRDPWARLVSHINWHARFLQGKPLPQGGTSGAVARVVGALARTDFESRESLLRFIEAVRQESRDFNAFDNMQVRMLMTGPPRITFRPEIGAGEVAMALANLRGFALVGFCEDQAAFRDKLWALLDVPVRPADPVRENVGSLRWLSPHNVLAREVLAPWVALDQQLYDAARRQ